MQRTVDLENEQGWDGVAATLEKARMAVALTGAGVSVPSGIPDFRSSGGLWTRFAPEKYATLDAFHKHPATAWELYRALGESSGGEKAQPGPRGPSEA